LGENNKNKSYCLSTEREKKTHKQQQVPMTDISQLNSTYRFCPAISCLRCSYWNSDEDLCSARCLIGSVFQFQKEAFIATQCRCDDVRFEQACYLYEWLISSVPIHVRCGHLFQSFFIPSFLNVCVLCESNRFGCISYIVSHKYMMFDLWCLCESIGPSFDQAFLLIYINHSDH